MNDLRYGLRILLKQPGYSLIAIVTLALGIGANTGIFAVVYGVLLRPLPFKDSERVVMVWFRGAEAAGGDRTPLSVADLNDWRSQTHSFESISALQYGVFNYIGTADPEQLRGLSVTSNFLSTLGVGVQLGREFQASDEVVGAPRVAILSNQFWRSHFNSDPKIIGSAINLSGESTTIVGVLPPNLNFPDKDVSFWRAIQLDQPIRRGPYFLRGVARLKPGVDIPEATAEARTIHSTMDGGKFDLNILSLNDFIVGDVRGALLALLVAVTLVLLIASVNVANLTLVRAASRVREMAIRKALGASQGDILRQLLIESVALAFVGGIVGMVLAVWGVSLIQKFAPENLPRLDQVRIEPLVFVWTALMSVFTGVVFGLVPAFQSSRHTLNQNLRDSSASSTDTRLKKRWRNTLVVAEMALAVLLIVGGGLLVKSLWRLQRVNVGINTDHLLTMQVWLRGQRYAKEQQVRDFYSRLTERVQALPGVRAAAVGTSLPPDVTDYSSDFMIEGSPAPTQNDPRIAYFIRVSPDYFRAFSIQLRGGRFINENDIPGRPNVTMINETLRNRFFGPVNPVGKRLNLGSEQEPQWHEIVGVVADVKYNGLTEEVQPAIYLAAAQASTSGMSLIIKTDLSDPLSLTAAVRKQVHELDPELPVADVATMDQKMAAAVSQPRFRTSLVAFFAIIALMLACVGIYGVISYSVAERTHEIGIRMALGAQGRDVLYMIIKQGLILATIGVALGITASYLLTRLMSSLLFGVKPDDLVTFAVSALLLAATALLATYLPARRATKVDPLVALRYE
jgi:putative ABC transport system permease protein